PASTTHVTIDTGHSATLHVAGTTSGGLGDVDLRCYYGSKAPVLATVAVSNGSFSTDLVLDQTLINKLGTPHPFCMLRAVPTGTIPSAPPDMPSVWEGVFVGWGKAETDLLGSGFGANPADTQWDFFLSRAQSGAMNDFYSMGSCGLCDTYLFLPGSLFVSNPIWWANAGLFNSVNDNPGRTSVRIDGAGAYTAANVRYDIQGTELADNPGIPAVSETHSVDPGTGNLTVTERGRYVWCAEDRSVYPPTDQSCASFADTGVAYERSIETRDSGHAVTIVDHWKSVDGKPHELDAIYDDTERSTNAAISGHQGQVNFTWTQDGFKTYTTSTQVPLPPSYPATMLVKTDASTGVGGDNKNPFGAEVFSSTISDLKLLHTGIAANATGEWQPRYEQTIPADGEITIATAYVHDYVLASVQSKAQAATTALTPPTVHIDTPVDGSTVDAASVHVSGTAKSADGEFNARVNGVLATTDPAGSWSADVPLSEGSNRILVSVANDIGVVTNAVVNVTRPGPAAPAAAAPESAPSTAPVAVAARPVRCVVPKLRGKTLAKAKGLLKKAHCRLGKVARKASTSVKPGRVVKTRLKAGSRHRAGTRVRVTIAKKA
ncbi:MAG TPA: PASTA domain-containing protein, partial [Thermoleophilaceae bacterium]